MIERLVRRDRVIMLAGLAGLTALAWLYLLLGAGTGMSVIAMSTWRFPPPAPSIAMTATWDAAYAAIILVMWWVMMIAMMTPSAAPMILLHARISRHAQAQGMMPSGPLPSGIFAFGYLVVWLGFSIAATGLQLGLERLGLVDGMAMWSTSRWLTATLLVAAGLYQVSRLKSICLSHGRSPVQYLSRHWRPGRGGAFLMGARHGAYCVGCCWVLMLLLFAGGVMNVLWIAGLSGLVLVERLSPFGARLGPATAALLFAAAAYTLLGL